MSNSSIITACASTISIPLTGESQLGYLIPSGDADKEVKEFAKAIEDVLSQFLNAGLTKLDAARVKGDAIELISDAPGFYITPITVLSQSSGQWKPYTIQPYAILSEVFKWLSSQGLGSSTGQAPIYGQYGVVYKKFMREWQGGEFLKFLQESGAKVSEEVRKILDKYKDDIAVARWWKYIEQAWGSELRYYDYVVAYLK